MPAAYYSSNARLTDAEVFALFEAGEYLADLDAGLIMANDGVALHVIRSGRKRQYKTVRLYSNRRTRAIAVHVLIWMLATQASVPAGFEVHHDNEDPDECGFWNLICVHSVDHAKLHGRSIYKNNGVPF